VRARRIVILGGGPGGYEAALVAAELGAEVTVVSDEGLGGNCVLWDCVPSKALIVSAEAMGWMRSAGELGVRLPEAEELDRTFVDYPAVEERVLGLGRDQSADIERKVTKSGARLLRGRGRIAGEHHVTVETDDGDEELDCDILLIATGSYPRVLPFFTPDGERVLTSKDVYDLPEVPERLVVVGSGATGAEFAHAFVRFGSDVVLVSSRELILPTEDPDAAQVIEEVFERRGMTILREVRAQSCERGRETVRVGLNDDSTVEGTHVLFTVGQVPASEGIGLEEVGVEVADWGGVPVDGVSRTNVPWIYAAGDVVGSPMMLANVAAMQGRTAMWHALGQSVAPLERDTITSTIFTDPEVATTGLTERECERRNVPYRTSTLDFSGNPRAKMGQRQDGFVKVIAMPGSGTLLGAVVVADAASDLIQPLAIGVQNRLTVPQVAKTSTVYPSMAGSLTEAARLLMAE
jgi:NAD(P)H dehydrogenase (quinone)